MEVSVASAVTGDSASPAMPGIRAGRRRFAWFHVFATFVLLIAGARVTSHDAGISVEDWPSSLGFFNPIAVHLRGLMQGLVAIEHGHREIAMVVGLLTIVEAVWLWRTAERPAVRNLGVLLLALVLVQGGLGGLTVRLRLPPIVSVAHGMLAQTFFCLSIATAWLVGAGAGRGPGRGVASASPPATAAARGMRRAAVVALGAVYAQLLLGAVVRHTVAKWRVPTFQDLPVVLHASFAAVVVIAIGVLIARAVALPRSERRLTRPALALGVLLVAQALLGVLSVVTRTDPLVTVLHVVTGAAILGLCLLTTLRTMEGSEEPSPGRAS